MFNRQRFFFLFLLIFCACSGLEKNGQTLEDPVSETEAVEDVKIEEKTISDRIILKDIETGKNYKLSQLSMNRPVFIEISASWCEACKDLAVLTDKLRSYYKNGVFFIRVYLPGDSIPENSEENGIIAMEVVESPPEISIETNEIFPRAVIIGRGGKNIEAVLDGIFPILVYHGILSGI
jgi:thiol-disulfide isomerase/thioredoxin